MICLGNLGISKTEDGGKDACRKILDIVFCWWHAADAYLSQVLMGANDIPVFRQLDFINAWSILSCRCDYLMASRMPRIPWFAWCLWDVWLVCFASLLARWCPCLFPGYCFWVIEIWEANIVTLVDQSMSLLISRVRPFINWAMPLIHGLVPLIDRVRPFIDSKNLNIWQKSNWIGGLFRPLPTFEMSFLFTLNTKQNDFARFQTSA